ncbi:hypothetical protein UA08_01370 [Talaromyces atroroseus]|uniref:Uncharacterized protein n=1 Tax=Talaromyces atroroseus TaxID=1441469 RepID=A0A1Q5QBN9_TALAT|nr:hypothetical protein UA08_01370 [Talaromyces atroroseus]OKL63179.1 hypothetical protein UA08_01370 [Talaromyces atroroseus]
MAIAPCITTSSRPVHRCLLAGARLTSPAFCQESHAKSQHARHAGRTRSNVICRQVDRRALAVGGDHSRKVCAYLKLENPHNLLSVTDGENVPPVIQERTADQAPTTETDGCEVSPPESPSAAHAPIDTFLEMAKMGRAPSSRDSPQSKKRIELEDLISRSILSTTVAQSLLDRYFTRLDHYIYGFAGGHYDLQKLRQNSPVLLAAICTVSALHDPQDARLYEICNRELRQLVSRSMFEKRDINYIRALCISSFWLADASRILSSDAIRRAADVRLHCLTECHQQLA